MEITVSCWKSRQTVAHFRFLTYKFLCLAVPELLFKKNNKPVIEEVAN